MASDDNARVIVYDLNSQARRSSQLKPASRREFDIRLLMYLLGDRDNFQVI